MTTSVADVTRRHHRPHRPAGTDRERYDPIDRAMKERVAACEKDGLRCSVASFFEGRSTSRSRSSRSGRAPGLRAGRGYRRVRRRNRQLALAPTHGRLELPARLRGPDGKPAAYSKDNVPYKPKHWLKVAAEGFKPGELVFVAGYPGRTQRHQTYAEVRETTGWSFPRSIRLAEAQLAIIDGLTKGQESGAQGGRARPGAEQQADQPRGMLEGLVKGGASAEAGRRRNSRRGLPPTRPGKRSTATSCLRCEPCKPKARRRVSETQSSRQSSPASSI